MAPYYPNLKPVLQPFPLPLEPAWHPTSPATTTPATTCVLPGWVPLILQESAKGTLIQEVFPESQTPVEPVTFRDLELFQRLVPRVNAFGSVAIFSGLFLEVFCFPFLHYNT